jgi:hypothetical protein
VKYLRLDPQGDPETGAPPGGLFRLPDDADLEQIADRVAEVLASGGSLTVGLDQLNGNPQTRSLLVINGSLVRQVLIGEAPELEPEDGSSSEG